MNSHPAKLPLPVARRTRRSLMRFLAVATARESTKGTRHFLCLTLMLITAVPRAVSAEGINIAWNECSGVGGVMNRTFACNTNSGSNVLVASFDPPEGITQLIGCSASIAIRSALSTLPSWWQMSAGGCRADALHVEFGPGGSGSCIDPWQGAAATGSIKYQADVSLACITVSCGVPENLAAPVDAGTEYTAFRVIMDNTHTVGSGACADCLAPACIVFAGLWLYQPAGMGDHVITNPHTVNWAEWQGGAIGGPGCPGTSFPSGCGATPALRRTWGLIKSLYR